VPLSAPWRFRVVGSWLPRRSRAASRRKPLWIVLDLNDLGVAGIADANFLVGGIHLRAAGIAAGNGLDAGSI